MLENLRSFAQPYGGDLFLLLIALAVVSLAALVGIRKRLQVQQLRRVIRVAALVALLGSVFAMQIGSAYYAIAGVLLAWGVLVGIIFGREIGSKR
ncbi:hypothetical protein [Comamonas resistens]|uniref:Uncharacterized protein n=1 Tax=Comamonas resistens TaxID=3046670 RepID=A0ABY8SY51_9BURK|nr:hypothetical protein [Comamonas resistens]MDL5036104.1 hypothetical protein [Comamonas resistens]WHS66201.1 hypothetical protein QMY55_03360 [Comamonas resistens]